MNGEPLTEDEIGGLLAMARAAVEDREPERNRIWASDVDKAYITTMAPATAVSLLLQLRGAIADLTTVKAALALQAEQWRAAVVMAERKGEELQTVAREAGAGMLRHLQKEYGAIWHITIGRVESGELVWNTEAKRWEPKP